MSGELGPLLSVVLRHAPEGAIRLENPEVRWWRASVDDAHGQGPTPEAALWELVTVLIARWASAGSLAEGEPDAA